MIRLSVRRPIAIAMTYFAIALLGVAAWRNMPIELLPNTQLPRLNVQATWPGASPEATEAFVTSPIEAAVQQVRGVEEVQSFSTEGVADISISFEADTDMNFARMELMERLNSLEGSLPAGVRPLVTPYVPQEFAEQLQPFLIYTVTGPYTTEALRAHTEDVIRERILDVDGVRDVLIRGGRRPLLEIELDPVRVNALGLTVSAVQNRIATLEDIREAGVVSIDGTRHTLAIRQRAASLEDLRVLPVLSDRGRIVRLGELATIRDTYAEATDHYRIDGRPAVSFEVHREYGRNIIDVADRVRQRIAEIAHLHPPGVRLILDSDESIAIREQFLDMRNRAIFSALVIFAVLMVFLRSFRSSAIVFATIGFSALITLNIIYWSGLSLNMLTLMGLAMGFGLIDDNAIVVLENIFRHRGNGLPADEAAERGAREMVIPVIAATLTTLIVVVPFVYLQGELRAYYVPLGLVVGMAVLASIFVSFTFVPALGATLLRRGVTRIGEVSIEPDQASTGPKEGATGSPEVSGEERNSAAPGESSKFSAFAGSGRGDRDRALAPERGKWAGAAEPTEGDIREAAPLAYDASRPSATSTASPERTLATASGAPARRPLYIRFYEGFTGLTLRFPWTTAILAALLLFGSWRLFDRYVSRGMLWRNWASQPTFIQISVTLPRGEEVARVDEMARFFEERIPLLDGVSRFVTRVNARNATIRVEFPDSLQYSVVPLIAEEYLKGYAIQLGGAQISVRGFGPAFSAGGLGGSSPNYTIRVLGYNYEKVREIAGDLGRRLTQFTRIEEVNVNSGGQGFTRDRATELIVVPDRARLAMHGLTARDLITQVRAAIQGARGVGGAEAIRVGGRQLDFEVKLAGHANMDVLALGDVSMLAQTGESVRLSDVATISQREVLARIARVNQQYERTIAYEFRGPVRLGDIVRDAVIETTEVPPGYTIIGRRDFGFTAEDRRQIYNVMAIALVLVFMLTAALFESVKQPFVVLLTVPMALVGVFLIFFYANASFTREAYIGVIMMSGIVVNNAILLVDHINRLRRETTLSLERAILQGALDRARPILMTTSTTVMGLLPLVLFSESPDENIWNALGYTLIGGLTSSTIFVLTVTPALYLLFERGAERKRLARAAAAS